MSQPEIFRPQTLDQATTDKDYSRELTLVIRDFLIAELKKEVDHDEIFKKVLNIINQMPRTEKGSSVKNPNEAEQAFERAIKNFIEK